MIEKLSLYPWSSYSVFNGKRKASNWLETDWLLSLFGKHRKVAAGNYQDFVEKINIAEVENPAGDLMGGFILGSSDFFNWVRETFLANRSEKRKIPQLTELKPKLSADHVVAAVCNEFDCNTDLILQKGRKKEC